MFLSRFHRSLAYRCVTGELFLRIADFGDVLVSPICRYSYKIPFRACRTNTNCSRDRSFGDRQTCVPYDTIHTCTYYHSHEISSPKNQKGRRKSKGATVNHGTAKHDRVFEARTNFLVTTRLNQKHCFFPHQTTTCCPQQKRSKNGTPK